MKERRRHARVKLGGKVGVTILSAPEMPALENKKFPCPSNDVSRSGAHVCIPCRLPVGATLEMCFSCGLLRRKIWHVGRVVWAKRARSSYDVGIRFTRSPEATLLVWEELLRDKLARAGQVAAQ